MRLFANTDNRTIVTRKYTLIYSLLFFCGSLLSFISSANAWTPEEVVLATRLLNDNLKFCASLVTPVSGAGAPPAVGFLW